MSPASSGFLMLAINWSLRATGFILRGIQAANLERRWLIRASPRMLRSKFHVFEVRSFAPARFMNIFFFFDILVNFRTRGVYFDKKLRRTVQVACFLRSGGPSFQKVEIRSVRSRKTDSSIQRLWLLARLGALCGAYSNCSKRCVIVINVISDDKTVPHLSSAFPIVVSCRLRRWARRLFWLAGEGATGLTVTPL